MGVHGEEGLEEARELPIVGDPPKEAHRHVRVGVHEPRHDGEPRGVDLLLRARRVVGTDGNDPTLLHPEIPANHPARRILCDEEPSPEHGRPGRRGGGHGRRDRVPH